MRDYNFRVVVKSEGWVQVKADSKAEALDILARDFGITAGSINTTNDEQVVNWDMNMHPSEVKFIPTKLNEYDWNLY